MASTQPVSSQPIVAILAGGLATRLGTLSASLPKSMIEVAGEPFISHQLRLLSKQGFCDVVICAGHLGKSIQDFVDEGSAFNCRVQYSFDGERLLGTGGALRHALPLLGESFLVIYGDSYLRTPFRPVWKQFTESGKSALMTVFRNENQWGASNVEFSAGEIQRYDKIVPATTMQYIDYGLGCIRAEALAAFAPANQPFDLAVFYAAMLERRQLAAYEVAERFYEIGSPAGLADTDARLRDRREPGSPE